MKHRTRHLSFRSGRKLSRHDVTAFVVHSKISRPKKKRHSKNGGSHKALAERQRRKRRLSRFRKNQIELMEILALEMEQKGKFEAAAMLRERTLQWLQR